MPLNMTNLQIGILRAYVWENGKMRMLKKIEAVYKKVSTIMAAIKRGAQSILGKGRHETPLFST